MPTIDGLVTGIDTQAIIDGLLEVRKTQKDLITARQTEIRTKQTIYSSIKDQIGNLRAQAATLGKVQNNVFSNRTVSLSDETLATATASSTAASGVYRLKVQTLAQAQQIATQGVADADSEITQGTLTLRARSRSPVTITIDGTNNTLSGLASAINAAGAGVSASVVQDASGARLVVSSEKTGTENAIQITNNLAASAGGATKPEFDFDNPVQEAQDASVTLGSGPGAVTVTSQTNRVSNLIGGVELNLLDADPSKTLTVTVARDSQAGVKAVQDFVDSYNALASFISKQTAYDAGSDKASPLLGDSEVRRIQQQIQNGILGAVAGVSGKANRLAAIGVSVGDGGQLAFNSSKLTSILNGGTEGVTGDDVRRLFALDGTSTNSGIRFVSGSNRTRDLSVPYQVNITQAAEQAQVTAANPLSGTTVLTSANNTFSATIDGQSTGSLTLSEGSYTQDQMAAELERVINAAPGLSGRTVRVAAIAGQLQITSAAYGTSSEVRLAAGTANTTLGFLGTENSVGKNVAGTFVVDGVEEDAIGSGQLLSGKATNKNSADLQVRVTLPPGQVTGGVEGEMTLTRGLAARLDQLLGQMLDPVTGDFVGVDKQFQDRIDQMQKSIDRQQALFDAQEARIRTQFTAMEQAVQQLQSTASLVGSQLAALTDK